MGNDEKWKPWSELTQEERDNLTDEERFERTIEVVNLAYKEMLERKARLGEPVYTDDGTGVMRTQRAIDVY